MVQSTDYKSMLGGRETPFVPQKGFMPNFDQLDLWLRPPTEADIAASNERKRTAVDLARELGARTYDEILFSLEEMYLSGYITEEEYYQLIEEAA